MPGLPDHASESLEGKTVSPLMRQVLPNGLVLLVQEDPTHPLVAFFAVVKTGSAGEGPYLGSGLSHVLEHMLFKGTARRPVGRIEQEARLYGGASQGYTTYDTTSYPLVVNKEYWAQAADLMIDALFSPSLDPVEFDKEREVVLRELKMGKDDPDRLIWDLLFQNAYRRHPYRVPIIGYEELVSKLTVEDARLFHRTHYLPNHTVLAVVGDVSAQEVAREIGKLTASVPPGRVPLRAFAQEPLPRAPRQDFQEADLNLVSLAVGFPSVAISDGDLFALDLLAWVLGAGPGSRLDQALKETGLVHSVSVSNYTPMDRGLFVVSMRTDPDRVEEATALLEEELKKACQGGFSLAEVAAAKRNFLRGYLASRQTVGGMSQDLATYEVWVADPHFSHRYLKEVERLTPEDLKRVALTYLKPERATRVALFPRGTLRLAPAAAGAAPSVFIEKLHLENGLTVLLRKENRLPLVTFQLSLLGGVRGETDETNGVSLLTARMLLRGTKGRSYTQIAERIRELGGELAPFSGRNSLGLTMEVGQSQALEALDLIGELITDSTFPGEELEKERTLALADIRAKEEDPFPWGMRRLMAVLFDLHPYRLDPSGNEESLKRLQRKELLSFYAQVLDPKKMVLAVVGDFKPEEILERVRSKFKKLKAPEVSFPSPVQELPLERLKEHVELTPRKEGLIMIGFRGLSITDPRVPALDLTETILSGGAGRLFSEIRNRRGLAYTVGAYAIHGIDPGVFVLYALTDEAYLDEVREALLSEIRRLAASGVSDEELEEARSGLLGAKRIARQTQAALALQMAQDELFGLGFNYSEKEYEAQVKAVTPQEIQALVKELLDPMRCAVVIGKSQGKEKTAASSIGLAQVGQAQKP